MGGVCAIITRKVADLRPSIADERRSLADLRQLPMSDRRSSIGPVADEQLSPSAVATLADRRLSLISATIGR
jgi:hypothetical protein